MSWQEVEGHDKIAENFARAFARRRLEGSYLFLGTEGIGKKRFALALAKTLLCQSLKVPSPGEEFTLDRFVPCGHCDSCIRFADTDDQPKPGKVTLSGRGRKRKSPPANETPASVPSVDEGAQAVAVPAAQSADISFSSDSKNFPLHPDLFCVARPPERATIPLELLVGTKEDRMRSGLCHDLSRAPFFGGRKVAVIDDADYLSQEGANAMLKTFEEPPDNTVMILLGTSAARQLPTIRSRCRMIQFSLDEEALRKILSREGIQLSDDDLRSVLIAGGSVNLAKQIQGEGLSAERKFFQEDLCRWIFADSANAPDAVDVSAKIVAELEKAGKEPAARRARLRLILTWELELLRDQFRKNSYQNRADLYGTTRQLEIACDRTLQALEQIDRNALLPQIVESWAFGVDRAVHR